MRAATTTTAMTTNTTYVMNVSFSRAISCFRQS